MPHILSFDDLRNAEELSNFCHAQEEPVYGTVDLAVMSIEAYEELVKTAAIDAAIFEAEAEYAQNGQKHDAATALAMLRRKL